MDGEVRYAVMLYQSIDNKGNIKYQTSVETIQMSHENCQWNTDVSDSDESSVYSEFSDSNQHEALDCTCIHCGLIGVEKEKPKNTETRDRLRKKWELKHSNEDFHQINNKEEANIKEKSKKKRLESVAKEMKSPKMQKPQKDLKVAANVHMKNPASEKKKLAKNSIGAKPANETKIVDENADKAKERKTKKDLKKAEAKEVIVTKPSIVPTKKQRSSSQEQISKHFLELQDFNNDLIEVERNVKMVQNQILQLNETHGKSKKQKLGMASQKLKEFKKRRQRLEKDANSTFSAIKSLKPDIKLIEECSGMTGVLSLLVPPPKPLPVEIIKKSTVLPVVKEEITDTKRDKPNNREIPKITTSAADESQLFKMVDGKLVPYKLKLQEAVTQMPTVKEKIVNLPITQTQTCKPLAVQTKSPLNHIVQPTEFFSRKFQSPGPQHDKVPQFFDPNKFSKGHQATPAQAHVHVNPLSSVATLSNGAVENKFPLPGVNPPPPSQVPNLGSPLYNPTMFQNMSNIQHRHLMTQQNSRVPMPTQKFQSMIVKNEKGIYTVRSEIASQFTPTPSFDVNMNQAAHSPLGANNVSPMFNPPIQKFGDFRADYGSASENFMKMPNKASTSYGDLLRTTSLCDVQKSSSRHFQGI